jgi:hypothetical protein
MPQKQLNVRVDEETLDVLEAAAFTKRASLPDIVRPFLEELARTLREEPAVRTALVARGQRTAAEPDNVTLIATKRGRKDANG